MSLDTRKATPRSRTLLVGHPKAGKTGSLVAAANAGYRVALLDFDNNPDPLVHYVQADKRSNVSIITLEETYRDQGKFVGISGQPTAWAKCLHSLDKWVDNEGSDWGAPASWGPDTILAFDSMTAMGDAAFNRVRFVNNRTPLNTRDQDYGAAMRDMEYVISRLTSDEFKCHILGITHLKMIGPKLERLAAEDNDDMRRAKQELSRINVEEIPTRWYPSILGRALPQVVAAHFPAYIMAKVDETTGKRYIHTTPTDGLDLGVPVPGIPGKMPIEEGLLTILKATEKA